MLTATLSVDDVEEGRTLLGFVRPRAEIYLAPRGLEVQTAGTTLRAQALASPGHEAPLQTCDIWGAQAPTSRFVLRTSLLELSTDSSA